MGNCLRLSISRVGLSWSKWRVATKFKRKCISILILGMQASGKSTIALRLYKFRRTLPDLNYVQTKGFNSYTIKRNKTTINIYDLGGHPGIQELWDHYYADSHGIVFVVDTSQRETLPEAGQLLSSVLNDHRIRGKPILLLANKIDLEGIAEAELDSMLNLQQLVNSVRCLTRLDVSSATDLKNDKGIFQGFKWLISYIESNYADLNARVLSDTLEEKNREKARREAVKAARAEDQATCDQDEPHLPDGEDSGMPEPVLVQTEEGRGVLVVETNAEADTQSGENSPPPNPTMGNGEAPSAQATVPVSHAPTHPKRPETSSANSLNKSQGNPQPSKWKWSSSSRVQPEPLPRKLEAPGFLPGVDGNVTTSFLVDKPVRLPRLRSPKSRQEIINRIEDHEGNEEKSDGNRTDPFTNAFITNSNATSYGDNNDKYNDTKDYRFRRISQRLSPEGADSDDGIVNLAYEHNEDLSSDSTPISGRRFAGDTTGLELPSRELFTVTTLAEVHKERKGSTSTHDSIPMSVTSMLSETTDVADEGQLAVPVKDPGLKSENRGTSKNQGKAPKRLKFPSRNKTAPVPPGAMGDVEKPADANRSSVDS